jgi:hypothetical protein
MSSQVPPNTVQLIAPILKAFAALSSVVLSTAVSAEESTRNMLKGGWRILPRGTVFGSGTVETRGGGRVAHPFALHRKSVTLSAGWLTLPRGTEVESMHR